MFSQCDGPLVTLQCQLSYALLASDIACPPIGRCKGCQFNTCIYPFVYHLLASFHSGPCSTSVSPYSVTRCSLQGQSLKVGNCGACFTEVKPQASSTVYLGLTEIFQLSRCTTEQAHGKSFLFEIHCLSRSGNPSSLSHHTRLSLFCYTLGFKLNQSP